MEPPALCLTIKQVMVTESCPPEWRVYDLYVFRDGEVVFYVGQSHLAFDRVWQHLRDGHKARSVIGRFILENWPAAMHYTVELLSAQAAQFAAVQHDLNAAEVLLIEQLAPCFNRAANAHPSPLPACYHPPSGPLRCSRNLNHLIREARYALQAERRKALLAATAAE